MNEIGKDTDEIGGRRIWAVAEFTSANCARMFPSLSHLRPKRGGKIPPLGLSLHLLRVELVVAKRQLGFGDREAAGCAGDAICGGVERARLPSIG